MRHKFTHPKKTNTALKLQTALQHQQAGDLQKAEVLYRQVLQAEPNQADAWHLLGVIFALRGQQEQALAFFDKAIAIDSNEAMFYFNQGNALADLKRFDKALVSYDRAIAIEPDYVSGYLNRANALQALNRFDEAIFNHDRVIDLDSSYISAYWNKSLVLLLIGDFNQGWPLYECRWKHSELGINLRPFSQPLWLGEQDIKGKTVLLHPEQGLGDTIQFCRYAQLVKARGATVIFEAPPPLMHVLNTLSGVDMLIEADGTEPPIQFDFHCSLMSLPLAFKTEVHSIPHPEAYLFATPAKRDQWAHQLGPQTKPRIGLVWSGSTGHKNDHNRSIALAELLPHLPAEFEYVCLQKEIREIDQKALAQSTVRHFEAQINDFEDTAALCELMDVVLSVDTSVAHLAGALGKSTWLLLPYAPDWRWLQDRDDSPWYASMKLYRQEADRQWQPVLQRVAEDLMKALKKGLDANAKSLHS